MLNKSKVATRLPAQDLKRARRFYAEKLGLEPIEERPGGLKYRCGNGYFLCRIRHKNRQLAWPHSIASRLVAKISMILLAFTEAFELTTIICSVISLILAVLAFLQSPAQTNADVGTSINPIAE